MDSVESRRGLAEEMSRCRGGKMGRQANDERSQRRRALGVRFWGGFGFGG